MRCLLERDFLKYSFSLFFSKYFKLVNIWYLMIIQIINSGFRDKCELNLSYRLIPCGIKL